MKSTQLKYKQVEIELRQLAQTLPAGAKLMAERDLALEYGCNFLTVRKALKRLVEDGLIIRRIGSGTFVADKPREDGVLPPSKNRIGVLVYQQGNAYASAVLQAIAHAALVEDIELRSCWVPDLGAEGLRQAELLAREGCVALTLPWSPHDRVDEVRALVKQCPIPVSLPIVIPGLERHCFEQERFFGSTILSFTESLCRYFHGLGETRIAFLGPDMPRDSILQQKLSVYTCFTARERLPTLCGLVPPGSKAMDELAASWREYRGNLAVVSYDDEHALRFMTAMHKIGLAAPADYRIVGQNNIDASHYSDPPLSTVAQNYDYIGHWLLQSALGLSRGEVRQSPHPPALRFLVRETCGGRGRIDDALALRLEGLKVEEAGAGALALHA